MSDPTLIPSPIGQPSGQYSSPIESRNNSNNSHSSSASELIIVDPTSIVPFKAFPPRTQAPSSSSSAHIRPASTIMTKTPSKSTAPGPSGNSTGHSCTSTCRRIATPDEIAKCGYVARPVSFYHDKAVYGTPTPSKVQAMDWMRSRYQSDACKKDCLWYHHPDHCEGYPCRGDILYCSVLDRCFFKERCVKHYAMRSRERCVPYNDGLEPGSNSINVPQIGAGNGVNEPEENGQHRNFQTRPSKRQHFKPLTWWKGKESGNQREPGSPTIAKVLNISEDMLQPSSSPLPLLSASKTHRQPKRQISDNDLLNENKRIRNDTPTSHRAEGSMNQPSSLSLSRSTAHDKNVSLPTPPAINHDQETALLTPSSQVEEQEGDSGRSASEAHEDDVLGPEEGENEEEEEEAEINDEMALMWKRMYAQTKDQLDATTIQALQVQDDLATEREKRVELETGKKKLEKQVLDLKRQLDKVNTETMNDAKNDQSGEMKHHDEKAELRIHELNEALFEALSEIKQFRGRVEKLDKEKKVLLEIRDQGMGMMKDFVEKYQSLMKGYMLESEGVSLKGKMR
ncbi:hypothetical protein I302_102281 [Kwoniella bestiolae CBS 10118]|uniref:Uncharacterized protein n=1 Tax=Kwoniella bestiolae CBS 10118 TaxID=1296100 RepID=A0A1B9GEN9_9TREE|nr:hypothetical protein I302_00973 [Kwoniella bestiolae CBS 10118]OCF29468.1 hypothetical protein I302_00973 [Kwoniella bestiolae CBS 10118]